MKHIINFCKNLLCNRRQALLSIIVRIAPLIPDKTYLKIYYSLNMGKSLSLDNPQTFSEKLQWLKLYNRKYEHTQMVDKYAVKEYVANIIGEEYIIPTLGVWDAVNEIDFDKLPNKFVLKTTHSGGSSGVVICKDKNNFDIDNAKRRLNKSMHSSVYINYREWPYKDVKPRIIAEQLLEIKECEDLPDYKFFCFNGEPKCCQVIAGRNNVMTVDFFDKRWNHLPFHEPKVYPFSREHLSKPQSYEIMWDLAEKLSTNQPFLRVDFYNIRGQIYFGELTFFPTSGMGGFDPEEWDYKLGGWITLPNVKNG